jgi:hypothetical protein
MAQSVPAKSVPITGGTDGLGKAAALLFAKRGYRVFAAGRSAEKRAQLDARARGKKLPFETLDSIPTQFLGIRNLEGQARFAQFLPLFGPGFVHFAFRVISRGIGARELYRVHSAEVPYLIALCFQPDIFDTGNFCGQRPDPVDGLLLIHLRNSWLPFVHDNVQNGFRLAESVLRRHAARLSVAHRDSC